MDRQLRKNQFFRSPVLTQSNPLFGESIGLFSLMVVLQGEFTWFIFFIIFIYIICYCVKRFGSEQYTEETITTSNYTQSTSVTSSFDIERQPIPRFPGPQQKYPKACPSCGKHLEEDTLKQLIISGKSVCKFCASPIPIGRNF